MLSSPSSALDLPLEVLVSETGRGSSRIEYNSARYFALRHGVPQELLANLAIVALLASEAAG